MDTTLSSFSQNDKLILLLHTALSTGLSTYMYREQQVHGHAFGGCWNEFWEMWSTGGIFKEHKYKKNLNY